MILADTSIWIEYFRHGGPAFHQLLDDREVVMHPMVLGELSCGNLAPRESTLLLLTMIPQTESASDSMVLHAIDLHRWFGSGIGWADAHLLTSCLLTRIPLLTRDVRLARLAQAAKVLAE